MAANVKQEWRDEWFSPEYDPHDRVIRVKNNSLPGLVLLELAALSLNVNEATVYLTPDEAEMLAEVLRLSARGLRGEVVETKGEVA